MSQIKGSELILKSIIESGANVGFGVTGGAIMPVFDSFLEHEKEFRHILVRHEQGAGHAAEGFARASGKPGVCFATSGPGATNLVTPIADAFADSVPIVCFGGQVATSLIGNDAFQEADLIGITTSITKHNFQIRDEKMISSMIKSAFKIAMEGRPGPVYVDLPKDIQNKMVDLEKLSNEDFSKKIKLGGNPFQIKKAAEEILNAERPVILAGGGTIISNASAEVIELAEFSNIPIMTTLMGKGVFPEEHPLSLGCPGMHGRKSANYALINADLIIAIGTRFSDRITGSLSTFGKGAKVIHIDIDSSEIGKNVEAAIPIVGDSKEILKELNATLKKMKSKNRSNSWTEKNKKFRQLCNCNWGSDNKMIHQAQIMLKLNKILKDDDIVVTGVGQHQMFAMHFLNRNKPRTFISSGGLGTMGFGLPAAMGAKVAKPNHNVINIDGDGSFQMTIQELATMKKENIKTISIILNNEYLGMVKQWCDLFFCERRSGVHLSKVPDFVKIAEGYGLNGIEVNKLDEFEPAMKQALKNDEATVINVHVDPHAHILPMFAAGASVSEFFGGCIGPDKQWFPGVISGRDSK